MNFGGDHAKLYDLIVRNFLASWHPIAEWTVIKRVTTNPAINSSRKLNNWQLQVGEPWFQRKTKSPKDGATAEQPVRYDLERP